MKQLATNHSFQKNT